MRRYPKRVPLWSTVVLSAAALATAGCGSGGPTVVSSTNPSVAVSTASPTVSATTGPSVEPAPLPSEAPPAGSVGVSPGGVTTKVDVPADATESQYGQACHAAKVWMDAQGGDAHTLVEPYLKVLQAPDAAGPGTFNTPWAQLTPAQQSGVIIAVTSASNAECG